MRTSSVPGRHGDGGKHNRVDRDHDRHNVRVTDENTVCAKCGRHCIANHDHLCRTCSLRDDEALTTPSEEPQMPTPGPAPSPTMQGGKCVRCSGLKKATIILAEGAGTRLMPCPLCCPREHAEALKTHDIARTIELRRRETEQKETAERKALEKRRKQEADASILKRIEEAKAKRAKAPPPPPLSAEFIARTTQVVLARAAASEEKATPLPAPVLPAIPPEPSITPPPPERSDAPHAAPHVEAETPRSESPDTLLRDEPTAPPTSNTEDAPLHATSLAKLADETAPPPPTLAGTNLSIDPRTGNYLWRKVDETGRRFKRSTRTTHLDVAIRIAARFEREHDERRAESEDALVDGPVEDDIPEGVEGHGLGLHLRGKTWHFEVIDVDGRRVRRTLRTKDRAEAVKRARDLKGLIAKAKHDRDKELLVAEVKRRTPPPGVIPAEVAEPEPLTPEEAQAAYDVATPVPISPARLAEIVEYATAPKSDPGSATAEDAYDVFRDHAALCTSCQAAGGMRAAEKMLCGLGRALIARWQRVERAAVGGAIS